MKHRTAALALALLLTGCQGPSVHGGTWTSLDIGALDAGPQAQYDRATAARDAMAGELMRTLSAEIASSGAAGAIGVCREAAPRIADSIAEGRGVKIGRTSERLRNPGNEAPTWAEGLLVDRPAEPRAARGPGGQLGALLPIHVVAPCLRCHGAPESLSADVREALASLYPDDRATGYGKGDLRGWFWVEVPAAEH